MICVICEFSSVKKNTRNKILNVGLLIFASFFYSKCSVIL